MGAAAMVTTGTVLDGLYRLERRVGRGGFGEVYQATDLRLKRSVAVKVLYPHLIEDNSTFLAQFEREAQTVAALDHPHILTLYYYGQFEDTPYLVMPYIGGGTLADKLAREHRLGMEQAWPYLRQAAEALDYAHRHKIVHRDIKPQNMLLRDHDTYILLADFGIARLLNSTDSLTLTRVMGSPLYMAPEQFGGQVGFASDIYALGCVLFHMLTGTPPYLGAIHEVENSHKTAPIPSLTERGGVHLPASLQAIVNRALAKRPEERFQSMGELASAVQAVLTAAESPFRRESSEPLSLVAHEPEILAATLPVGGGADQLTMPDSSVRVPKSEEAAAWVARGAKLFESKRWEEALAAYDEALRISPGLAEVWASKGATLNKLFRYKETLSVCEHALRLDPGNTQAWTSKARALGNLGRREEASVAYKRRDESMKEKSIARAFHRVRRNMGWS
jgi:serine/threonine protein kinase